MQALIDALEAADEDHSDLIAALQAKDAELEKKIAGLQAYVDGEITATEDWAEATFATLAQYEAVQKEIAAIKALIEQNKTDLTSAYTKAIKEAIAQSETSMKAWVNKLLAEGYYNIAEIDGKLAALKTMIEESDAALAEQLKEQKEALEQAKKDLTAAYKRAIEDAIDSNSGAINEAIAKAVQEATEKVNVKLALIEGAIADIRKEIGLLTERITSVEEQIKLINASINELKAMDVELKDLIDALVSTPEGDSSAELMAFIKALQAKDADLEKKISDLKAYIDGKITTKDWAEATFATLAQYEAVQKEIAAIKALIEQNKTDLTSAYTKAIKEAIAQSETSMKAWVNKLLAEGYYDIADIDAKLEALEADLADADAELAKDIKDQQAALEQAKKDLTAAYEAAIKKAIEDGGVINDAIADAIAEATNNLQSEIDGIKAEITSIKSRIEALEKNFANRIQSLTFVPQYSDGNILMDHANSRTTQAHFRISPASIAKLISAENVTAFARYTYDPTTRAFVPEFPLSVMSVTSDDSGVIEVNLKEDSNNLFDPEFWNGDKEAVVYIRITDDNGNDVVSEAIPMIAHNYVGNNGNSIDGFVDEEDEQHTGTVAR